MNIAIILAGGKGKRMGLERSKQYIELQGKPVIQYSIETFMAHQQINEIIFVVAKEDINYFQEHIINQMTMTKPYKVIAGGAERQNSVYNGLMAIEMPQKDTIVLIHDAARPMMSKEQVTNCILEVKQYEAVSIGMPVKDTIKVVNENGLVVETPERKRLWLTQTPQGFSYGLLKKAHDDAIENSFVGTDDASLVEAIGHPVRMIEGSYENIKITTKEDLIIAEAYITNKK